MGIKYFQQMTDKECQVVLLALISSNTARFTTDKIRDYATIFLTQIKKVPGIFNHMSTQRFAS